MVTIRIFASVLSFPAGIAGGVIAGLPKGVIGVMIGAACGVAVAIAMFFALAIIEGVDDSLASLEPANKKTQLSRIKAALLDCVLMPLFFAPILSVPIAFISGLALSGYANHL